MISSRITFLMCPLVFISHVQLHASYRYRKPDPVADMCATAAVVAGTALAGYGVYKLLSWLSSPSNEELIRSAHHALNRAHHEHHAMITFLQTHLGSFNAEHVGIMCINEQLLYTIACDQWRKVSMRTYIDSVCNMKSELERSYHDLDHRITKLRKKSKHDASLVHFLHEMEGLRGSISTMLTGLELARSYLKKNINYFELYEKESELMQRHANLLYVYECGMSRDALRTVVVATKCGSSSYPYLDYARTLRADIDALRTIIRTSVGYIARIHAASELFSKLDFMYNSIISDKEYMREVRAHEQYQLEQQRLEQERRKAQALENQARAAQDQARELRRKNDIKQQELCEKRIRDEVRLLETIARECVPGVYLGVDR